MSGITVLSPVGINQVAARPMAPRLASLEGVTLGILNNSKPNSLHLQERVAELLGQHAAIAKVVTKQKSSQSHLEDLDPATHPHLTALQATKGVVFRTTEPGHFHDWHNAPRRQYVITLEGEVEIGLGDGTVRRCGPGHMTLAEDLTGRGHTTRVVGGKRWLTATIHLAD